MSTFLLALMLLCGPAQATSNATVTTGVVAAQQSDWELAIDKLTEATSNPDQLSEKYVAKAWFWLGEARLGAFREAGAAADTERLASLSSAPLEALDAFEHARAADTNKRWESSLDRSLEQLTPLLLQGALSRMQESETSESKSRALADARVWADAAVRSAPDTYLPYNIRGQISVIQGRSTEAKSDLEKAATLYETSPPDKPDPLVVYVHHALAVMARTNNELDEALMWLDKGLALLDSEAARLAGGAHSASEEERQQRQTASARDDLTTLRLEVLLNAPAHRDEALKAFQSATTSSPNNVTLRVAYAQLLMPTDTSAAIEQLDAAIALEPKNLTAVFNLAALYQNEAARLSREANDTSDSATFNQLQEEVKFMMMKARPHFETAWELDPTNISVASALEQICFTLGDDAAAETWRNRRKALLQP